MQKIVITPDQAVFWMDERGRWCNEHGPFKNPKIINYFNSALGKDEKGWFVEQIRDDIHEQVYFRYIDTPLFGIDVIDGSPRMLVLNTGNRIPLEPDLLFVRNEHLYQKNGDDCIKLTDRSMIKLAESLEWRHDGYYFHDAGRVCRLPENPAP